MPLPTIDNTFVPAIRIASARDIAIEGGEITWVSFTIPVREDRVAVDVPAETQVVGIEVESEGVPALWGAPEPARDAGLGHEAGAAIAWRSTSGGEDHLDLAVAPRDCSRTDVVRRCAERITLALVLPALARVEIEPAPARVDGRRARGKIIAIAARPPAPVNTRVTDDVTLVARQPPQIFLRAPVTSEERSLDARTIRRRVRDHAAQLRWCYELQLQRAPRLTGTVELRFTIAPDGHVTADASGGDLASGDVRACLERELVSWEFPDSDETVKVSYPLRFLSSTVSTSL